MNEFLNQIKESQLEKKKRVQALFIISLFLVLLTGPYLWVARVGWVVTALLFMLSTRFALYAVFFFASFFMTSGFMKDFIFTIKHFHIAVVILMITRYLRGIWLNDLNVFIGFLRKFWPLLTVVFVGVLNYLFLDGDHRAVRFLGNWMLVFTLAILVAAVTKNEMKANNFSVLRVSIIYFVFGTAVQVTVGIINLMYDQNFWDLKIIHNNHIGVLCATTFFYAIYAYASEKIKNIRPLMLGLAAIIFAGLITSCSRTSWLSVLFAFLVFVWILSTHLKSLHRKGVYVLKKRVILLLIIFLAVAMSLLSPFVFNRIKQLTEFFKAKTWIYTFGSISAQNGLVEVEGIYYKIIPLGNSYYFHHIGAEPNEIDLQVNRDAIVDNKYYVTHKDSGERRRTIVRNGSVTMLEDHTTGLKTEFEGRRLVTLRTYDKPSYEQYMFKCFQIDLLGEEGLQCESSLSVTHVNSGSEKTFNGEMISVDFSGAVSVRKGRDQDTRVYNLEPFVFELNDSVSHSEETLKTDEWVDIQAVILNRAQKKRLNYFIDQKNGEYQLGSHNFGFLGHYRLAQLRDIKSVLRTHPFIGMGFIKQIVDFHGIYFVILGATGIIGLLLYLFFLFTFMKKLLCRLWDRSYEQIHLILLASFCTLLTWLIISIMETYILQFSVWINFAIICCLIEGQSIQKNGRE